MKTKRLWTLIGSICLSLVLAALLLPACAPAAPEEVAEEVAELEGDLAASEKKVDALEDEVSDLEKEIAALKKPVEVKPIVWRLNSNFVPGGICDRSYKHFAAEIEERSGGRLIIEPYFNASLGFKPTESLSVLKKGLIELNEISPSAMGEEPIVSLGELPFLFTSLQEHKYFCQEKFFPAAQQVFDRKGWNITVWAPYYNPSPVYFFSKEPLRTIDDWQGLKLRCWGGIVADAMIIIGTDAYVISTAELYTALQRGLVTAAITSYMSATETHFWEVLNYINKVPVNMGVWMCAVNNDALNALPADLQEVFWASSENLKNFVIVENALSYQPFEKMLTDGGMEIVLPEGAVAKQMKQKLIDADFYINVAELAGPEATELLKELGAID